MIVGSTAAPIILGVTMDVATTARTVASRFKLQVPARYGSIAVRLLACTVARMMVVAKKAPRDAMTMASASILRPRKWSIHSLLWFVIKFCSKNPDCYEGLRRVYIDNPVAIAF